MRRWHVIFDSRPRLSEVANAPRQRFAEVATAGQLHGRKIIGMWMIDDSTEQVDVSKIHGDVPEDVLRLHHAYLRRQKEPGGER